MAKFFISDLHLQAEREDLAQALYQFVSARLHSGDTLFILGDFFDAWIGDDEDQDFYLQVKSQLKIWVESGISIKFMHGNRDFLIGEQFASDTGVELITEPHILQQNGKKLLLMHGDSLCTGDVEYIAFRQQVRNPAWQNQVLSLPLAQRRIMAADMRSKSQSMNSNKAEDIMDVTPAEVKKIIQHNKADILLHGHTHRPGRHKLSTEPETERIVLGDWGAKGWFVVADELSLELHSFDIQG